MLKKEDHYLAGSLLKTSGIKGEIILRFNNNLPKEIKKPESILVEVDQKLVPFFIEDFKIKSNTTAIVKIEGINNDDSSTEFIGCDFYLTKEQAKTIVTEPEDEIDVAGYKVIGQNNVEIGEVIEFIDIAENPLLNVKTPQGEVLIPAQDELIIEIDDDERYIILTIPEGLFDLEE